MRSRLSRPWVAGVSGGGEVEEFGLRQDAVERVDGDDLVAGRVRGVGIAHAGDVHAEGAGVLGGAAAEGAEADEDDAMAG